MTILDSGLLYWGPPVRTSEVGTGAPVRCKSEGGGTDPARMPEFFFDCAPPLFWL